MKMTPSVSAPSSEPPQAERPEVSPADAAAFLATLATAIHSATQTSSDLNEADTLEGASAGVHDGSIFETALAEVEWVGESSISLGHHRNLEGAGPNETRPALSLTGVTSGVTSAASPLAAPLASEGSATFDGYVAPALLLPSQTSQMMTLAAPMSTPTSGEQLAQSLVGSVTAAPGSQSAIPAAATTELSAKFGSPSLQNVGSGGTTTSSATTDHASAQSLASDNIAARGLSSQGAVLEHVAPEHAASEHVAPEHAMPEHAMPKNTSTEGARFQRLQGLEGPQRLEGSQRLEGPQRLEGSMSAARDSENLAPSNVLRRDAQPSATPVAPSVPRQDTTTPLLPNEHEALAAPMASPTAMDAQSNQAGQQIRYAERAPAASEASHDTVDAPVEGDAPLQRDARRTDRQHDEAAASRDVRSPHASGQAQSLDAIELATTAPERGALENSVVDVAAAPVSQDGATTTTTQAASPESHSSSPSRLLEHLRASFPTAEVRISEGRAGETLVSMNHPDFGAVELNLQMTGNGIDIAARVDGAIAANLLRRSETSLRKAIHRRGLSLGRLRVERNTKHSSRRSKRGIDLEA